MPFSWPMFFSYVIGIAIMAIICNVVRKPANFVATLIANGLAGAIVIIVINFIGYWFGFSVPLNPFTALVVGVLGVPGIIVILLVKFIFMVP